MAIFPETLEDAYEIEYLYDLCFAPGRQALSSYKLRHNIPHISSLSYVWRDDSGYLLGAIRYWPVYIAGQIGLLLGPVAVHPTAQGEGVGGILIRHTLQCAKHEGWARVILIGDAPYYARFGFSHDYVADIKFPPPTNPERFLGLALEEHAFDGLCGHVEPYRN